jgi:hypothetical protein
MHPLLPTVGVSALTYVMTQSVTVTVLAGLLTAYVNRPTNTQLPETVEDIKLIRDPFPSSGPLHRQGPPPGVVPFF